MLSFFNCCSQNCGKTSDATDHPLAAHQFTGPNSFLDEEIEPNSIRVGDKAGCRVEDSPVAALPLLTRTGALPTREEPIADAAPESSSLPSAPRSPTRSPRRGEPLVEEVPEPNAKQDDGEPKKAAKPSSAAKADSKVTGKPKSAAAREEKKPSKEKPSMAGMTAISTPSTSAAPSSAPTPPPEPATRTDSKKSSAIYDDPQARLQVLLDAGWKDCDGRTASQIRSQLQSGAKRFGVLMKGTMMSINFEDMDNATQTNSKTNTVRKLRWNRP